jgi:hypothetical protein
MESIHEIISFRFKDENSRDEQFAAMAEINVLMLAQVGLISRETFYSDRDDSWVTLVGWEDEGSIDAAGLQVETNERAMSLFARFDPDSMRYARYRSVTSTQEQHEVS